MTPFSKMANTSWWCVALVMLSAASRSAAAQRLESTAPPQYVTAVKCSFVVFGQFNYEQAKQSCLIRNATLAFFTSPSEDHSIRKLIDWESAPGFLRGPSWVGQLWLGIQRQAAGSAWVLDNPIFPGAPIPFASWISGDSSRISSNVGCVLARKDGWVPFDCNGTLNNVNYYGGALCTLVERFPPQDPATAASDNYCNTFLLPPESTVAALPMIIEKRYFFIKGSFTYDQAMAACAEAAPATTGATSRSAEEYAFISQRLDFGSVDNKAWIGLRRVAPGSTDFRYIDGWLNTYYGAFLDGEPSLVSGDCISSDQAADSTRIGWKATPCDQRLSVLCESFHIL